jgi:hypothetical protein
VKKLKSRKLTLRRETLVNLRFAVGGTSDAQACIGEGDGGNSGYVTCVTCNNGCVTKDCGPASRFPC